MKNLKFVIVFLLASLFTFEIIAQQVTYHFKVHTKDVSGAGTDLDVSFLLEGSKASTEWFKMKGDKERDDVDSFTYEGKDIGKITAFNVYVHDRAVFGSAGDWALDYVYVTKNSDIHVFNHEEGYYQFKPNRFLGFDKTEKFYPIHESHPQIMISPIGTPEYNTKITTMVNFGSNGSSIEQEVMPYKETWSKSEAFGFSKTTSKSFGTAATLKYESPPTAAGTFGAEFTASFNKKFSETKSNSYQEGKSSTFDWTFRAPPNSSIFRKVSFNIPYDYQEYEADGETFYIRKLHAEVIPEGFDFLEIPRIVNGEVVPVSWNEIEKNWYKYVTSSKIKQDILREKLGWIREGYVYEGNQPPVVKSTPNTPKAKPTTVSNVPTTKPTTSSAAPKDLVYIRNKWVKYGTYDFDIHIQENNVNAGESQPNWHSAHWTFEPTGDGFYRIQNRWEKYGQPIYLHNQNGKIEAGEIKNNWWSAQWKLVPTGEADFYRIQNRWYPNKFLHIQNDKLEVGEIKDNWSSAQWKLANL